MGFVFIILKFFPWEMVHDYPKDIQEKTTIPEPTSKQKRSAKCFAVIASLIIFGAVFFFGFLRFSGAEEGFLTIFLYVFVMVFTWNVIDLLLMDWLIVCTITPSWIILQGSEGCKGYKDYGFHFKGFLIGCVYSLIMALIFSGVIYGVLRFFVWQ